MNLQELSDNPQALRDFNAMSREDRMALIPKIHPDAVKMDDSQRFELLTDLNKLGGVSLEKSLKDEDPGLSDSPSAGLAMLALPGANMIPLADAANVAGEGIAEKGGEMGHPNIAAAAGTAVSMAPFAAAAKPVASAMKNIAEDTAPFAQRVMNALTNSRAEVGKKLGAAEEAVAGPQKAIMTPKEKDVVDLINENKDKLSDIKKSGFLGDLYTPQELIEMKNTLSKAMNEQVISLRTREGALASQMKSDIEEVLNHVVEGRKGLAQQYGDVMKRNKILKWGGISTGLGLAYQEGKKLLK